MWPELSQMKVDTKEYQYFKIKKLSSRTYSVCDLLIHLTIRLIFENI